jgi:succinate-acetate transporter protein
MSQSQMSTAQHSAEISTGQGLTPTGPMAAAIADPGPVGLAAFAMTTFMLSVFNTNIVSSTLAVSVLPLALFYGGAVQLLAGMWEFRNGNTFGALAFSSFGAFWLAYWYYLDHVAATLPAADAHKATGVFLLSWAIFTAYMTIASLRTTAAIAAVFAGGWAGLVTAALAWYASFAGVTNATFKRTMLPTWPLDRAVR